MLASAWGQVGQLAGAPRLGWDMPQPHRQLPGHKEPVSCLGPSACQLLWACQ